MQHSFLQISLESPQKVLFLSQNPAFAFEKSEPKIKYTKNELLRVVLNLY